MAVSPLATESYPAYEGNYSGPEARKNITAITIHHMAGVNSAKGCGAIFQQPGRNGSSHYGIGVNGEIAWYVDENCVAWTNSNWPSNQCSVTIENSNSSLGGEWPVSDATLSSCIKLVADIAKRNGLGTLVPGENLTWHSMFAATSCVPTTTEVLSRTGWKTIAEVEEGEDIATVHIDDLSILFSPVLAKVPERNQDTWETRGIEATSDHNMLWKTQGQDKWRVSQFKDLPENSMVYLPNAGHYTGKGLPLSDNEIKLLVAVQADGHYEHGDKSGKDRVTFHLSKQRKIELLDEILKGYDYNKYQHADGTVSYNVRGIKALCDEWLEDKKFTFKWLEMSPEQSELFLDIILDFDGCRAGNDYSSAVKQNIDVVDAIAALNGIGIRHNGDNRTAFVDADRTITKESDKKRHQQTLVSCVTVASGLILVRQHGRTTVIGNCPGDYLRARMQYIADEANKINGQGPAPEPTPTPTPTPAGIKVGDKVVLKNWVDYNGTPLRRTRDFYYVSEINGDRAVLRADSMDGVVYCAANVNNLEKVGGSSPAPAPAPAAIRVGDTVTLKDWVDYNGTPLRKTRDYYFVMQLNGDRAVLTADSMSGPVYCAANVNNLRRV